MTKLVLICTSVFFIGLNQVVLAQTDSLNQVDSKGRKQGAWSKNYPNGQVRYAGQFKNDKPIGTFQYFNNNGVLMSKVEHREKDTAYAEFYHDGIAIMSSGKYYKQERVGIWKYFDGEGDITSQCIYLNGKKHGPERIYFKDGRTAKELSYTHGFKQGQVTEFFPSGKVKFKGTYVDDNLDGEVEYFHPNGAPKALGNYQHAVKNNTWTLYDGHGKVKTIQFYKDGRLIWSKTPEQLKQEKAAKENNSDNTTNPEHANPVIKP
jgi:antitoxin component YwqK of YwqJK toxin-antitoxin module